jgi:hypothetical protein
MPEAVEVAPGSSKSASAYALAAGAGRCVVGPKWYPELAVELGAALTAADEEDVTSTAYAKMLSLLLSPRP